MSDTVPALVRWKRRLALRTRARRVLSAVSWLYDLYWDWRCGGWTGGVIESPYRRQGARSTQSTRYAVLRRVFRQVAIRPDDVLVDVGCGKGRVIAWWLALGCRNRIVGLELDPRVAAATAARFAAAANVAVVAGDALEHLPADGTLFWLYHPFEEPVLRAFRDRLKEVCRGEVRLVYNQARHLDVFREDPAFTCESLAPGWLATGPVSLIRLRRR
jgi:SAM-dependent methyltransferase